MHMRDVELTFTEVAVGQGVWRAMRGRAYVGMIVRHSDTVYVPIVGGIAHPKVRDLESAKAALEAVDGCNR
jgi:hypothetical protein